MREVRSFHTHLPASLHSYPPPEVLLIHFCTFARGTAAFALLHLML